MDCVFLRTEKMIGYSQLYDAIWRLAKSILGIWQVGHVKLASVRTIVLYSSSNTCIYGGRGYSGKEFAKEQEQFLKDGNKFLKVMKCS